MPVFVEDPAHFSKSRLKSDLVAHNVSLPPAASKKEVYVELHLKHIDQKNAADFSSDEEDQVQDALSPEDAEIPDPSGLTDDDLKAALLKRGVKAGPIVASTRALYEKKLSKLLQSDGHDQLNGAEKGVLYSDSEEEEEEENGDEADAESACTGAEEDKRETVEQSDQAQQESSQNDDFDYPQCFLPSSRLHVRASRHREPRPKWNSGNALKSSEQNWSRCTQIPAGISRASSVDQRSGLGSGLPQEPVKDTFKDLLPDAETTPTGIYATRRRPIKGAAGRPIQYAYPDTPASPTTLERREVERRLVPIHIQILVFLIVACLLYLIYVCVEDSSFVALLDSLSQGSESEEGLLVQTEAQDTLALSEQE
ncbi:LEM domain-containing protein 1 isoform X3 [Lates calcarifer]|uniref:LEM domain-containing protein 1 isoform X3 n=1 Tax=Lates calcarifer TaxID=8187 RepID=A0AAJ7LSW4_LATCA|nr:LEM domain-containing protein 1 isoform X3 [Lates calcarifer]